MNEAHEAHRLCMAAEMTREAHLQCTTACCLGGVLCVSVALERWLARSGETRMGAGVVHADVDQNVTFSRPPSGEWLARTRMRSDGDDLGGKGRANSPP